MIKTRWMHSLDIKGIREIDAECSKLFPGHRPVCVDLLKDNEDILGVTATDGWLGNVVGYLVYRFDSKQARILNLAVKPARHHQGIASRLVDYLIAVNPSREIQAQLMETNLGGQLFLRAKGFRATEIIRSDRGRDAYSFVLKSKEVVTSD